MGQLPRLIYGGPSWWLIWLNIFLTCIGVMPGLLVLTLKFLSMLRGDWTALPIFVVLAVLELVGQVGYVPCLIVFLSACILLLIPAIPWRVRLVTAAVEISASAYLVWVISVLRAQPRHSPF
jgi:hypothetical protein